MELIKAVIVFFFCLAALNVNAQKIPEDDNRYFEIMFFGVDSVGEIKYGTYYFSTNYFPTQQSLKDGLINTYKLKFRRNTDMLAIIISEFKNREEFLRLNRK